MVKQIGSPLFIAVAEALGHAPTSDQTRALDAVERLLRTEKEHGTLVLSGYAGTGKTTLVGALVKVLYAQHRPPVLLAPTGRAAKVLAKHADLPASTIHRRIYRLAGEEQGSFDMDLASNPSKDTLFIVDEASMIGTRSEGPFGDRDLLTDLFSYVFSTPGTKLLLVGDPAQLPPVGEEQSPALSMAVLRDRYGLLAGGVELKEVVRQGDLSGILENATGIRSALEEEAPFPRLILRDGEVVRVDGHDLQDELESAYARFGQDEVCLICRSNKRAYQFSQQVRARILGFEEELCAGDRLMVVKNNYLWAAQPGRPELMANGETIEVLRVLGTEERYGLRFADLTVQWSNGKEERELDVKVILDVLAGEGPSLPGGVLRELSKQVLDDKPATNKQERSRILRSDPYANALQVKYAYAVTCHKAQGGQWDAVFVDQGFVTEEMIDREYTRWLYTAVTRPVKKLLLVNFHPRFYGMLPE